MLFLSLVDNETAATLPCLDAVQLEAIHFNSRTKQWNSEELMALPRPLPASLAPAAVSCWSQRSWLSKQLQVTESNAIRGL